MAHLPEEKRNAQHFYATRAICVRFTDQKPWEDPKKMYDNQYVYKLKRQNGRTPQQWELHFKNWLKKVAPKVLEASIHDVSTTTKLGDHNRIAQLVTNGHFLY